MVDWKWIAVAIASVIAAFQLGYSRGVQDCPAHAEADEERQAAIERDIELALSAPTGREAVCDKVFDLIEGELWRETIDEQAARAIPQSLAGD